MATVNFFASSADILSKCQAVEDDLSALLDPETGYAPRFAQLCRERLEYALENMDDLEMTVEMWDTLRLEANTWDLLQILLSARKTEAPLPLTAHDLLKRNPYTPTATLAQSILEHSRLLNELVSVREWLHDTAPAPRLPEATTGYWKLTKHRLLQALRTGNKRELDPLITELDPDAPNRSNDGKDLCSDDANFEKALSQALYVYIRAGRLDEAVRLCRKSHRPWRAASIRGSLLFRWRALADVPQTDGEYEDTEFVDGWGGNKRRKLWKAACTQAALNPLISDADRALYAALAPSSATSVALKSACRTWEDYLWAEVSIICEAKQTEALARAGGGFWDGGVDAIRNSMQVHNADDDRKADAEWQRVTIESLEALASNAVEDGPNATDPFHISQLHIILNRTDKLLTDFASGLESGEFNPDQSNYATLTRFFAHLCLFLQMLDLPVPGDAMQVILEVYLHVLEEKGQRQHIAMYASALGANAIERYALYLTDLGVSSSIEDRRMALKLAESNGLDIISVAQAAAEKTMESAFGSLPHLKIALPTVDTRETPLDDLEWFLVRSIEWTTFMEKTYPQALEQANAIFRYFLGAGKVFVARTLLHMLPQELRGLQDNREHATEFLYYLKLFTIWDLLDRISESQATESMHTTKGSRTAWINSLSSLVSEVREKIIELLTTDWLQHKVSSASGAEYRHNVLIRLRRIYIPELIIRLHSLLISTSDKIEGNLKKAIELANTVADSRYHLYDDFLGGNDARLKDYILGIRHAVLKGLEGGGSNPFWLFRT